MRAGPSWDTRAGPARTRARSGSCATCWAELRARLADRYRASAQRIIADGDYVVVQARGEATTKDGSPYNNEYCFVYRMENGKIREVTEYLDTELVTQALAPARP